MKLKNSVALQYYICFPNYTISWITICPIIVYRPASNFQGKWLTGGLLEGIMGSYLRGLDSEDVITIQSLRKHRNDLAHELPEMLNNFNIDDYLPLLEKTDKALFKLSNYRAYMEIGEDPEFQNKGINWDTLKGHEYLIFQEVLNKINELRSSTINA